MSKNLSRRDFLKLAGATSAGLALSACGVKAPELLTATPTSTLTPTLTITPTSSTTPTPTPLPPLPRLHVDGRYVKRSDTNEIVQLKGLNVTDFAYDLIGSFSRIQKRGLKTITENNWPINLFRVGLNLEYYRSQRGEIGRVVEFAEQHGIYIVFYPNREGETQPNLPDPKTADMMSELVTRYKNKNHILYGLFNEPVPENQIYEETGSWPVTPSSRITRTAINRWREVAQPIAEAIRAVNPKAIVVVPGHSRYASELYDYIRQPFEIAGSTENIIYDVHVYGNLDKPDQQPFFNDKSFKEFVNSNKYPVLVGEFGGVVFGNSPLMQTPQDIQYMRDEIAFINRFPGEVHYAAWGLDPWDRSGVLEPPDYDRPTPRGELILADLQENPPTDFRK